MPRIDVLPHDELCTEGVTIEAPAGTNLCELLLQHHIGIEHACELSCACTTCHVVVQQGFESLNEASDNEEDLLDKAWGLEPESRLSCQCIVGDENLQVKIPRYTINHAKENH